LRTPLHDPEIHGESGLDGTSLLPLIADPTLISKIPAVPHIAETILNADGKITLIAVNKKNNDNDNRKSLYLLLKKMVKN